MIIELGVTGKMYIKDCPQQKWSGDSPDIMQRSLFAGQEMIAIQKSDDEPELFELLYLGYKLTNIEGMEVAKEKAPEFARKVLTRLQELIV